MSADLEVRSSIVFYSDTMEGKEGKDYTIGALQAQLQAAIEMLPKTKQSMFVAQLERLAEIKALS